LLCIYFILHIQLAKSDSLHQQRNCSNELEPLLNLVSDQGKRAVLIPEENQMSVEHITLTLMWNRVIYINIEKI